MSIKIDFKENIKAMFRKKADIRFESSEESKEATLYIYGPIGSYYWRDNSSQSVRRKLSESKASKIHVHINSPGGSAFDGVAIMNLLKNHSAEIVIHVDGYAASAASVIAMAGDKVIMPENTMMMIHRASTFGYGSAADFEKLAKDLKKIDTALAASYKKRFVGEQEELNQLLDDETWLTAEEAVAFGFADEIEDEIEIKDLEDLDDDQDDDDDDYDFKDRLVAKYSNSQQQNEPETPAVPQAKRKGFIF